MFTAFFVPIQSQIKPNDRIVLGDLWMICEGKKLTA
jgi:hypothetical protein